MDIRENQGEYRKLGDALRKLMQTFDSTPMSQLKGEMETIFAYLEMIGAPLIEEYEALQQSFERLRKNPKDSHLAKDFLKQALRLEQETREI